MLGLMLSATRRLRRAVSCEDISDTLDAMKRAAAFSCYYVGMTVSIATMFSIARDAEVWQFLFLPLYGLPIWWIAAGIGIRLGVYPSEFFRRVGTAAGLVEPVSGTTFETAPER